MRGLASTAPRTAGSTSTRPTTSSSDGGTSRSAWGRDYGDVSPLRGVLLGGAEHKLLVGVSVVPMEGVDEPLIISESHEEHKDG